MRLIGTTTLCILGLTSLAAAAEPLAVDFETLPSRTAPFEGAVISDQYWDTVGVRFTAPAGQSLSLARVGAPQAAFAGFDGVPDAAQPGAAVGQFFLTAAGGPLAGPGPYEVEYRWPVQVASAVFLDVNERESWKAEAFDAAGLSRGQITIWPTASAGSAIKWTLDVGQPVITRLKITFTGTAAPSGVTFAFDNFRGSRPACAADLNGDSQADFADYLEFLGAYERADALADVTADGVVDFTDYLSFLAAYDAGC